MIYYISMTLCLFEILEYQNVLVLTPWFAADWQKNMETTVSEKVMVGNAMGLHARPAAQIVHIAGKFKSSVFIRKAGCSSNADCRSVLALLMLAASRGTELEITATGCDAAEAIAALSAYFQNKFGEN